MSDEIAKLAQRRKDVHAGQPYSKSISKDGDRVGMKGEFAFGEFSGLMPDLGDKPLGDGGIDFTIFLRYTVDVKTACRALRLMHEVGKPFADIYVLAEYYDEIDKTALIGWEWGKTLAAAPTKDFGHGVVSHYIPREHLRPMKELSDRLLKI